MTTTTLEGGPTSPPSQRDDLLLDWERALANIIAEVKEEAQTTLDKSRGGR